MGCLICITTEAGKSVVATQGYRTGQHAPQEPCRSFVLRDVICAYCNACTDLDLCRDPNLQVLFNLPNWSSMRGNIKACCMCEVTL